MEAPLSRKIILLAAAILFALATFSALRTCVLGWKSSRQGPEAETGLTLTALLGDTADGFAKAPGPRPFRFPEDHGPHPEFRSEWWYFTGNLKDTLGREFGYQLTFFRSGLRPPSGDTGRTSPWAASHAYMAHFALTEVSAGRFHAYERFSRAALGLAGAEAGGQAKGGGGKPFRVWLEDWSAVSEGPAEGFTKGPGIPATAAGGSIFPIRLRASQGPVSVDLVVDSAKPLVLQGERGFSVKGAGKGNASYYYSYTRMPSSGRVTTPEGTFHVTGESWLDREWGSSILTPGLAGWEWFGLQLADSTEYLFFRLRKEGPEAAREDSVVFDYGIRVDARGNTRLLGPGDRGARVLSRWTGALGRTYPSRWRIRLPSESLEMEVEPKLAGQELDLSLPYWEGAVRVEARKHDQPLAGQGYMELTGY